MCSHLCTYSHWYFIFVHAVTHSHKKLNVVYVFSDSFVLHSCSCHVLLAEFRTLVNLTGFHVFAFMHVFAQIFYFRTGGDAFSQKIERSLSIFSFDSFVVYSCSCHVLLAEAPLSELISRFVVSCYDITRCFTMCTESLEKLENCICCTKT